MRDLMTVPEVAEYLRIKERKVYDLLARKEIPCTRVTGKWLFPKQQIDRWLMERASEIALPAETAPPPPIISGSHDPLLEWALRETGSPLAMKTTGSVEGLERFHGGEALACCLHVIDTESGEFNVPLIRRTLREPDYVVLEWAWRQQGLLLARGNPRAVGGVEDLVTKAARVVDRQAGSGSGLLLRHLLARAGIQAEGLNWLEAPVHSETDVGLAVASGKADAGFAIEAVARQLDLAFLPLIRERMDLVVRRRDYFGPPFQRVMTFCRMPAFAEKAAEMGGYDVAGFGQPIYNP